MTSTATFRLAPGTATGVGSMPGLDPVEATRVVVGGLPDLPHLPELPARGPGADLLGRTAALLPGLHVDLQPAGWRFVPRPGRDESRGSSYLSYDLDALEEVAAGHAGPLKLQLAGPWTLAAGIELQRGNRALTDAGAVRDVAASLADAARAHVADVRRRLPGAEIVVQVDEPSLPSVLAGRLLTASGFGTIAAVPEPDAQELLRVVAAAVVAAGATPILHCCAPHVPVALAVRTAFRGLSLDLALDHDSDAVAEAVESGLVVFAGAMASTSKVWGRTRNNASSPTPSPDGEAAAAERAVRSWWHRLGFAPGRLPASVVVTPACGLAGASPEYARAALEACREAGRRLREDPEGR